MKSSKEITPLKKHFDGRGETKGFKFTQIRSTKWGFLYEVNNNGVIYYEVFKRRVNKRFATESYPSSKSFGLWAWWDNDLKRAENRLDSLKK